MAEAVEKQGGKPPGIGVDAMGGAVIDPTKNVLDLVAGEVKRLNDLREADGKLTDAKLAHIKEVHEIRADCAKETRVIDTTLANLRADHAKLIRELDVDRLEKIRQIDVSATNTAVDRALVAIQTLATTQSAAAETQRSMVTSTAATMAAQLEQQMKAMTDRIAAVEKSIYTGAGAGAGKTAMWGFVAAALTFVLTSAGIATAIVVAFR
jgi:hypothetical protein